MYNLLIKIMQKFNIKNLKAHLMTCTQKYKLSLKLKKHKKKKDLHFTYLTNKKDVYFDLIKILKV